MSNVDGREGVADVLYGHFWNDRMRFMVDVVSAEAARQRYLTGPWFSVAVGSGLGTSAAQSRTARSTGEALPVPEFVLEVEPAASAVNTFFYDEHGSVQAIYHWTRQEDSGLFLNELTVYSYPDEPRFFGQDEALGSTSVEFRVDGTSRQEIEDRAKSTIDVVDRHSVDLSKNWEPVPEFGDWAGLGRADRRVLPTPGGRP